MPFIALAVGVLLAAIDQIIKYFVVTDLKPVGTVNVLGEVFRLTYVENPGVAFGMFAGKQWIFIILTAVLLALIIFYMFKKRPKSKLFYITVAMIIGGGIGNLIDRVLYRYVVDYLSFSFFPPVCNFADYCITIGVFLLAFYLLFLADRETKGEADKAAEEAEEAEEEEDNGDD